MKVDNINNSLNEEQLLQQLASSSINKNESEKQVSKMIIVRTKK